VAKRVVRENLSLLHLGLGFRIFETTISRCGLAGRAPRWSPLGHVARRSTVQTEARLMARQTALPSTLAPRLIGREAAAAYVSLSPNTFDDLVDRKLMPRPRILGDKRRAWDVRELDAAADALPHDGEELAATDQGWT
jgi:hypothetical protein